MLDRIMLRVLARPAHIDLVAWGISIWPAYFTDYSTAQYNMMSTEDLLSYKSLVFTCREFS